MHFLCFIFLELYWNSDDEDDDTFEPERSFSGVFNTSVNQVCLKKYKNVFKVAPTILLIIFWNFTIF